jgi:hypothetical protein
MKERERADEEQEVAISKKEEEAAAAPLLFLTLAPFPDDRPLPARPLAPFPLMLEV